MTWHTKQKKEEVLQNPKRRQNLRKRYLRATSPIHKFGIPIVFLLVIITYGVQYNNIYSLSYTLCDETFGVSLWWMFREWRLAHLHEKCLWQKSSILGLAAYNVMNICFVSIARYQGKELGSLGYEDYWNVSGFVLFGLSVVAFMVKEEIIDKKSPAID